MLRKSSIVLFVGVFLSASAVMALSKSKESTPSDGTNVRAGTKISAQLESTVDAKTAKPGDEVKAKVTHNVKQDGKVVIHKGDYLVGSITSAQASSKSEEGAKLGVTFDRLVSGDSTTQLRAVVSSVLSSSNDQSTAENDLPMASSGAGSGPMSGGERGNVAGGVMRGTTSTAGSIAGAAGSAAGNLDGTVSGPTSSTLGGTTNAGLSTPSKMIHIDSAALAGNQTSLTSSLSTRKGDLRLDSGTRMEFRVSAQGSEAVH
jgi:hypothetical protein